jgi:signal transduction histidine kinase
MDNESGLNKQNSKARKLPLLIMISAVIVVCIYLVFAQYNVDRIPVIYLSHTDSIYTTYFELDNEGNRVEIYPVFGGSGLLEGFIGSDFLDSVNDSISNVSQEGQMHRIGFSRILFERLNYAQLVVYMEDHVQYIMFLDDVILYSDFPDPYAAAGASFNHTGSARQHIRGFRQEISFELPPDFTGMTLSIIEFITPEHAMWWSPVVPRLATFESASLVSIMEYGPDSVIAGSIGAGVVLLTVLLTLQMLSGKKTWGLLILPIIYGLLSMLGFAFVGSYSGELFWVLYEPIDVIVQLTFLCGGNLLLIFLSLKMKNRSRYILLAAAILHMLTSIGYFVYNHITFGYMDILTMPLLGIFGFFCIVLAFVLMLLERKENRYFKKCIWITLAFVTGYILLLLVTHFTGHRMFHGLILPVYAIEHSVLLYLNIALFLLVLLLVIVFSIEEYSMETAKQRSYLSALELMSHMKTGFLENVSYELKTPLTSVSALSKHSYSVLVEDSKRDGGDPDENLDNQHVIDEIQENLRVIIVESDRMKRVIDGLLDVAAIEQDEFELHREYFSLPDLVQEIGGVQFKTLNTNENTLKLSFAPDLPKIYADRDRLQDVLLNLLTNASRHTKNGTIVVAAKREQKKLLLAVSDNGEGIPEDLQKSLFSRFLGADTGRAHGIGMGLYICKQIIELHGGSIYIESKPGKGTAILMELPIDGVRKQL